ncbi:MAG: hypothetical protein ACKOC5_06275 [Chloroflexota bacterium]
MVEKNWQTLKVCYCQHVGQDVALEAEVIFPAEIMPEQAPRVLAHRCSQGLECNADGRAACLWSGTNPAFDPFIELL